MKFALRNPVVANREQQMNNEDLVAAVNTLAKFFSAGTGAPTSTPDGPSFYMRQDLGVGTAVYAWDGTSWKSVT